MCGIVGYVGVKQAAPILLSGLSKLEYRGYDSAGLAVRDEANEHIEVVKAKGRLKNLMEMTDSGNAVHGLCGIGHTRWATHGEPSTVNAHPQYTREKRVVIVHNGIIENYQEIKESLLKKGYTFASQTDTEVAAALLDSYYAEAAKRESDPRARALDAIRNMMIRVRGSYALGILFGDQPGVIYAARKDSPLILGRCDGEYQGHMIASDVPAVLNYTRNVVYIDNQEIACLTRDELHVYNIDCEEIEKPFVEIKWDAAAAEKDGYEHFMMKEIHEQPRAVRDTLSPRIKENESGERYIDLSETGLTDEDFAAVSRVYLIGCGSAYHVGMAARFEQQAVHIVARKRVERLVEPPDDALRRVDGQDLPAIAQRHAVAAHRFVHVGRRNEHRNPLAFQLGEHIPELAARHGVHARRRLVEKEHRGPVDQRAGKSELPLGTQGKHCCAPFKVV